MKITLIMGTMRKSSTYNTAKKVISELEKLTPVQVTEFFLPKDMPHYCLGCFQCFNETEQRCPHYDDVNPIATSIEDADLIIIASPVYVYNVTGQLKTLLDHLGYQWLPHRPRANNFNKIGLAISTTAGGGTKHALATIIKNFNFWGISRTYSLGLAVFASHWSEVKPKTHQKIDKLSYQMAHKIYGRYRKGKITPNLKLRLNFMIFRFLHIKGIMSPADQVYWSEKGWLKKERPF